MKVLFMGTPDFAVACAWSFNWKARGCGCCEPAWQSLRGRGKKLMPTPVKEVALKHNIDVYQPERIKNEDFVEVLKGIEADIYVVVAYGQILSQEILDIPKFGCINVHGSLLPKYRGAAPIQWSIINGEDVTWRYYYVYDKRAWRWGYDFEKGNWYWKEDTYETLHDKMAIVGAEQL